MTEHMMLAIVKGIPPVPGDSGSLEHIDEVLDLLNLEGFSVGDKGWIPKLPQVKNGGTYIDNPNIPDHFPVALALGHVQETMTLTVTGSSYDGRYWIENRLLRLAKAARDFWITEWQQQPVYLLWQAPGAKGPQYARIYTIDIAGSKDIFQVANVGQITITIDREHGWLLIPPGANPKWASYIINDNESGFNNTTASLYTGTDHAAYGTCYNRQEFATLYTFLTQNFIDIPAAKIPGDLPALACVDVEIQDGQTNFDLYIAKSTKPTSISDRAGNNLPLYNVFAASGAKINSGVLTANLAQGIIHTPVSGATNVVRATFSTTAEQFIMRWTTNPIAGTVIWPHLNPRILRGTYGVYVRANQTGGVAGNIKMRMEMVAQNGAVFFNSGQVTAQLSATATSLLHYMGTATIGDDISSQISARGLGSQVEYDFDLYFYAQRSTGSATLDILDVVLMPIDEGQAQVTGTFSSTTDNQHIYDNTGYYAHGKPDEVFTVHSVPSGSDNEFVPFMEPRSGQIMLEPNVNNRLYFLAFSRSPTPTVDMTRFKFDVFINLIPRWSSVRDI